MSLTGYTVSYSFAGFQANSPNTPLPGQKLDAELYNIAAALVSTQAYATATASSVANLLNIINRMQTAGYGTLPIMRHEALLAMKAHSTSGTNWLDAFLAGVSPLATDSSNIKTMEAPFWPVGGQAWGIVKSVLNGALVGGFDDAALANLQVDALALRATP